MRVIDILIGVAEKGGVENVINLLGEYLVTNGWRIRVVQLVWEGIDWTSEGIEFFPIFKGRGEYTLDEFSVGYDEFLKNNGVPSMIIATVWPYMCNVARNVVSMNAYNIPIVSWGHHGPVKLYELSGKGGYDSLAMADYNLAINDSIYNELKRNIPNGSIVAVRNPVDLKNNLDNCFQTIKREDTNYEGNHLLYVGRISEEKSLDTVMKAMTKIKTNWILDIIGDGEVNYKNKLMDMSKELKIAHKILWHGWKRNPWDIVLNPNASILASQYEGMPLTALESLSRGIPVIATPTSGIPELIVPGMNGYLFDFGDDDMLSAILDAIADGLFPDIDKQFCLDSVLPYRKESVLPDFEGKIEHILELFEKGLN